MTKRKRPDAEARMHQAKVRLGEDSPSCASCGESDARCLEAHHIAGRAYHHVTGIICRNCHRKLSDLQRDHPMGHDDQESTSEVAGRLMLGIADLFEVLIETLRKIGAVLIERAGDVRRENQS